MPVIRLLLVRHGESEWNAAGILQGHGGPGLTARGRAQAEATAKLLGREHPTMVSILRSDLERVAQTAAPAEKASPGLPVRTDERLREIDLGSWTGLTREQAAAADPELYAAWGRGDDVAPGHGETFAALRERVVTGLSEAAAEAAGRSGGTRVATVVVFTHGGPVRVAVASGLGLPAGGDRSMKPVGNCAVSVLELPTPAALARGRALLCAYNRGDHLDTGVPG